MICVSIGRTRHKMVMMEIQHAGMQGADFIELRLDFIARAIDIKRLLQNKPCPMMATFRRKDDGGRWSGTEEERHMQIRQAIVGGFDWIDVETDIADTIKRFGKVKRVVSYHNIREMPRNLEEIHEKMCKQDADVIKLAVRAEKSTDNWRMLSLVKNSKKPTVGICMGDLGIPSRILGAKFGAPFTYAAFNKERGIAPGMLSYEEMIQVYDYDNITPKFSVYGVVGDPIEHSLSPIVHNAGFRKLGIPAVYVPLKIPKHEFGPALHEFRQLPIDGYSVTIPHKETAYSMASERDTVSQIVGACNTLIPRQEGGFRGFNTDFRAALNSLHEAMEGMEASGVMSGRKVLILGAGGVARTLALGLHREGALVIISNRTMERGLKLAEEIGCRAVDWNARNAQNPEILINCTPVGMHPNIEASPVHPSVFRPNAVVMDVVYNPENTLFIKQAKDRDCKVITGVQMFLSQAAEQFTLMTGKPAPLDIMSRALRQALSPVKNEVEDQPAAESDEG